MANSGHEGVRAEVSDIDRFRGVVIGTAVGDAIGLPAEGVSRSRNRKMFKGEWRHRFFFNKGMLSDDTEHAIFTAQSLIAQPNDPELFARRLGRALKWWVLTLPAGVGNATLRSALKLWIGFRSDRSGVFSAGNGPAMRVSPIGAFFADSAHQRNEYVRASTLISHTDPKALTGARAVADLAAWIIRNRPASPPDQSELMGMLLSADSHDEEWLAILDTMNDSISRNNSVEQFGDRLGLSNGVTGYIFHTVPVAVFAWYIHFGDFRKTLCSVFDLGGDTDTVGAIAGSLAGAVTGETGIPVDWKDGLWDWPRNRFFLMALSDRLYETSRHKNAAGAPVKYFRIGVLPRNILFFTLVLAHGFRRAAPPYG